MIKIPFLGVFLLALLWWRCRRWRRGAFPLFGTAGFFIPPFIWSAHFICESLRWNPLPPRSALSHLIVFLVHPLIKLIQVQNPLGMDLHTHTHINLQSDDKWLDFSDDHQLINGIIKTWKTERTCAGQKRQRKREVKDWRQMERGKGGFLTFLGFSAVGGSSTAASTSLAEIHVS